MSRDQAKIFYGKSISSGKDLTGELSEEGTQQVADEELKYYSKDDLPASSKGKRPAFKERVKQAVQSVKSALTGKKKTYKGLDANGNPIFE